MRWEYLSLARAEVPRYTSYPTAAQFSERVDEASYREWLAAVTPDQSLSLYLHVPFCRQLCWYCGCHTAVANDGGPVRHYADILRKEAALARAAMPDPGDVRHVHFGGGSPGLLEPDDFLQTMDVLREQYSFAEDAEVAIELDPRSVSNEDIAAYAAGGVNRASFGVQEFAPHVQRLINREQPFAVVQRAVRGLRAAGIRHISFDLMYGLPAQRVADLVATAALAADLAPDRISLFGYAHVPWFKPNQKLIHEADLPSVAERYEQAQSAAELFQQRGYVRIGLDHFARDDDSLAVVPGPELRRNFQGYTDDPADVLLGFGASAIGQVPGAYVQNEKDIRRYLEDVGKGRLPVVKGLQLTREDALRADVIERLMCELEVDVGGRCEDAGFNADRLDAELAATADLENIGLLTRSDRRLRVSEEGRQFVRSIAACFDAYLAVAEKGVPRHSKAV